MTHETAAPPIRRGACDDIFARPALRCRVRLCAIVLASWSVLFGGLCLSAPADDATGPVVVIASTAGSSDSLSKGDLKNAYLNKKTKWPGGKKMVLTVLAEGEVHKAFLKKYVGKSPSQFRNYWKRQVFTGKGRAPKSFKTEKALAEYVAKTPGAIGYVSPESAKDLGEGAKVVAIR